MKKNILNKLAVVGCLLLVMSCAARKQVIVNRHTADTSVSPIVNTVAQKIKAIKAKQINFNTFSGKAKTKLDVGGNANDVTLNIRILRDQKIWVSITAIAGIEVARALITPDSLLVINRLQSVYLRKPFAYIYTYASKQIDYKTLESLLIGNAIPKLLNDSAKIQPENGNIAITGNLKELLYKLVLGPDLKVSQTNMINQNEGQSVAVINSAFIQASNRVLPSQIDITAIIKEKKNQVNLHYVKIDFDQALDFPFSIPSRYEATN